MNSNYEWQTYQVNERQQARLDEAEAYRRTKSDDGRPSFPVRMMTLIPWLVGVIVVIWLLTGCAATAGPVEDSVMATSFTTRLTMADRIHFQDEREVDLAAEVSLLNSSTVSAMTMGDRIRFQDRIWAQNR